MKSYSFPKVMSHKKVGIPLLSMEIESFPVTKKSKKKQGWSGRLGERVPPTDDAGDLVAAEHSMGAQPGGEAPKLLCHATPLFVPADACNGSPPPSS